MGLGVLDVPSGQHVPGTVHVLDSSSAHLDHLEHHPPNSSLKYDYSGPVPIILVPQPSDDPNDPLNWPLWRRDFILFILCFMSVIAATTSPLLAANTLTLSLYYGKKFTDTALLTGYQLCGVGVAGFLCVASARVWGKRHLYLLGAVLLIVSSIWGAASGKNYASLLWARVFQGVALAPFESLVNASVGDLYFVHERGKRMAVTNVALFGSSFLTPVFVGKITHTLGWQWTFWLIAIIAGAAFPLLFFFAPETAFVRAAYLNTDFEGDATGPSPASTDATPFGGRGSPEEEGDEEKRNRRASGVATSVVQDDRKESFWKSLRAFNGRKTDENFWKLLLRPFPLFFHPGIFWACLIQGALIGWTTLIGVVIAIIFYGPPLWFNEVKTGYLYTGPFLGAIIGLILSGLLSDWLNKVMIRANHGVYEPEFRLVLVIPQLIFGAIGLYGLGNTADDVARWGWLIPDVFFAFVIIGMVMGAVASALYVVDAYRNISIESFTCLLMFKNMFSFALTWYAYDWITTAGISKTFNIVASVQVGICLLSVPMYIFGKWNRAAMARFNMLGKLGLS